MTSFRKRLIGRQCFLRWGWRAGWRLKWYRRWRTVHSKQLQQCIVVLGQFASEELLTTIGHWRLARSTWTVDNGQWTTDSGQLTVSQTITEGSTSTASKCHHCQSLGPSDPMATNPLKEETVVGHYQDAVERDAAARESSVIIWSMRCLDTWQTDGTPSEMNPDCC